MYSKNVILFFFVVLYLSKCQGAPPTRVQLDTINNIARDYANPDGIVIEENCDPTVNLKGIKDIIEEVAVRINIHRRSPSLEELQTIGLDYIFTLFEVLRYVKKYLNEPELRQPVEVMMTAFFNYYRKPRGINFQELKELLGRIREGYRNSIEEYPYPNEPKTAIPYKMANLEYKFTRKEVNYIVIDYFFPGYYDAVVSLAQRRQMA